MVSACCTRAPRRGRGCRPARPCGRACCLPARRSTSLGEGGAEGEACARGGSRVDPRQERNGSGRTYLGRHAGLIVAWRAKLHAPQSPGQLVDARPRCAPGPCCCAGASVQIQCEAEGTKNDAGTLCKRGASPARAPRHRRCATADVGPPCCRRPASFRLPEGLVVLPSQSAHITSWHPSTTLHAVRPLPCGVSRALQGVRFAGAAPGKTRCAREPGETNGKQYGWNPAGTRKQKLWGQ